jgi:lactate dehydrogenase-like 2-hydroxyacid dehydrogenase
VEQRLAADFGATLSADDRQLTRSELRDALRDFDILLCTLTDPLGRDVLETPSRRTRLLANFGAGTDHIDLAAAHESGLIVSNTPGVLTEDTADLTILLMLAVARRAWEGDRELRAGAWKGWSPTHLLGSRVSGKSLGIVGFGRIGRAVARRAHAAFGMSVRYVSPRTATDAEMERQFGARRAANVLELAADVDFLSVHCPATSRTRHLISAEVLAAMRPTAYLINTARGDIVDQGALLDALARGRIAGAALDVFEASRGCRTHSWPSITSSRCRIWAVLPSRAA